MMLDHIYKVRERKGKLERPRPLLSDRTLLTCFNDPSRSDTARTESGDMEKVPATVLNSQTNSRTIYNIIIYTDLIQKGIGDKPSTAHGV